MSARVTVSPVGGVCVLAGRRVSVCTTGEQRRVRAGAGRRAAAAAGRLRAGGARATLSCAQRAAGTARAVLSSAFGV